MILELLLTFKIKLKKKNKIFECFFSLPILNAYKIILKKLNLKFNQNIWTLNTISIDCNM